MKPMAATVRILSPVGHVQVLEVDAAMRPASLDGLRPGILENRKSNGREVMEAMVEGLRGRASLGDLTVESKPVAGLPSPGIIERLTSQCDFILVGTSD
jgi:hypothetical protein